MLKPCPFCKGEAKLHQLSGDERDAYADSAKCSCSQCGASSAWASGDTSKPGYADNSTVVARAIAAWNRRPEDPNV